MEIPPCRTFHRPFVFFTWIYHNKGWRCYVFRSHSHDLVHLRVLRAERWLWGWWLNSNGMIARVLPFSFGSFHWRLQAHRFFPRLSPVYRWVHPRLPSFLSNLWAVFCFILFLFQRPFVVFCCMSDMTYWVNGWKAHGTRSWRVFFFPARQPHRAVILFGGNRLLFDVNILIELRKMVDVPPVHLFSCCMDGRDDF